MGKRFQNRRTCASRQTCTRDIDDAERTQVRTKLHQYSVSECAGYPYSTRFSVGYPYMVTANVDVEDGLVNGVIGTLQYVERLTEDQVIEEQ